ncbi:MAG: undecaprenyl-phosphate N-acetylglucosaminyl 1-phosphate transferase [Patescibacteria group bacterium]|nr:undecaprenyl-phosphate N-acetylglucosaminyl 1-phosphate transferase [Patescibacteria group bacterium]
MNYLLGFGLAFAVSAVATPLVRRYALAHGVMDQPSEARKIHKRPVAYLGGVAIFVGFALAVLALAPLNRQLAALLVGCAILVVVGIVDDKRGLSPWTKLAWQFVAAGVALAGGIGITSITNPLGGTIDLSWGRTNFELLGVHFHIMPIANALSLIWMVGLANTVNFLDGLDGLACGVSGIAALVMFAVAVGPEVHQPAVALLAIVLAGAALGFLPYNFFPARIFMGDSGAYFLGLVLAMLSIYSGAKIATAALVLGFPIIDALWAATRRLARRTSPFRADRQHFHHLLIDAGMSQRQAVLTLYAVAGVFGTVAVMADSMAKLVAMGVLVASMAAAIGGLIWRDWSRRRKVVVK